MNTMKKLIFIFLLTFVLSESYSQNTYVIGLKVNPSIGYIRSGNLNKSFEAQKRMYPEVDKWNANSRLRFNFGFGGFYEFYFSGKFAAVTEPTINFSNTKTYIHFVQVGSSAPNKRDELRITSEGNIHLTYFNIPILAKYVLSESSRFYVLGGLAVNLMFKPKLRSTEKVDHSYWTKVGSEDLIDSTVKEEIVTSGKLNVFNTVSFNAVLGVGKMFRLNGRGRNLYIDIRYSLPLSKSAMYTTNNNFDAAINNRVFGYSGKTEAEKAQPQYKLNDFRLSQVTLSLSYTLKNK
jgi:hypothetical protein